MLGKKIITSVISRSTQLSRLGGLTNSTSFFHLCFATYNDRSIQQGGINEQYIHQKFDHHSLTMINKLKNQKLMTGMPTKIPLFHDTYNCPIYLLSNATKVPRTTYRYKEHYKPGKFVCLDYSFWNVVSIRGSTSILSAICMKIRYIFVFPTQNKRHPLAKFTWFIKTLCRQ